MNPKIIELRDVLINYGKIEAVRGVNLALEEGGIIALMGANGAGKSSILKAIIGLEKISKGEILFAGEKLNKKSTPERVRMGVALSPEGRMIFSEMDVMSNLLTGAYLEKNRKEIKRRLEEVFKYFPTLYERHHQTGGSLSGGEQQMLAIGRALMAGPKLLLLDEPSLGLAPLVIQALGNIIKEIHERGVSIILAEQNIRWALGLVQYGLVLENGKIAIQGSYEELNRSEYVKRAYLGVC